MRRAILAAFVLAACTQPSVPTTPAEQPTVIEVAPVVITKPSPVVTPTVKYTIQDIINVANESQCLKYRWKDRGGASKGYIKGMAVAYAKAQCSITKKEVSVVAAAKTDNDLKDVLSWYKEEFAALSMDNSKDGRDTLRHAYVLLVGLGMRESTGNYCRGRDMSAGFSTADSAEAGIFQASWGARRAHPSLTPMMENYFAGDLQCYQDIFKEGLRCKESDATNWGTGQGVIYQKLAKSCPMFSVEYSAILVRTTGGSKGEFGPLRKKAAEVRTECDDMFKKVDAIIDADPKICARI